MHDAPLLSGEDGSTDKPQAKPAAFHLKRLEMVGFKSFAERTRLEFEPGITAVVGPNGCGKSNVVDAIRWCLGEMSAKSLRSKMLVDVIFNGSANRAPTHMAEVSLTFDNSQNRLPVDYSEVTVARRLFRSGESEYFINKTQCRLRDIHELFLDTGIGEEGYSIMEQGRVEYILNARPEERRELFEEAAGVSKYKARREECLRKMERTQLDLDRLADVIAMTKEQMDKIEAAVRKARQYQKLQEDLKSLEITHWLWEISQMDQEITGLKAEIAGLENDLQSATTEIDQVEAKLAELRLGETELGERLVSLNRQISEVDGHMALAEQKQANAREREEEIRRRETVLEAEIAQGRARLEELGRSGAEVESSLEAEKRSAEEAAALRQKEDANHRTLLENQKALEKQAKDLQNHLWQNNQERTRLHNEIASQRSLETRLDMEQKVLEKDRVKAEEKRRAAAEARTGEDPALRAELERLESEARTAKSALQDLETGLQSLAQVLSEAQARYYEAKARWETQQTASSSDPYASGSQALLNAGLPGLHGPLGRLVSAAPSDESAVRQALGGRLQDWVADTLEDAQSAVRFLAENGKGRARLWVLDRLPALDRPAVAAAVGQRALLDMVKTDPRFQPVLRLLLGRWMVSNGVLYGEGVVEGGSDSPAPEAEPLGVTREEMDRLHEAVESLAAQKASQEARRAALAEGWEQARQAAEAARVRWDFFQQEGEKRRTQILLSEEEIRLIDTEIERVRRETTEAEAKAKSLEEQLAGLNAEEERLRGEWHALQESLQSAQAATAEAAAQLAVVRERAQTQEERLRWQESQKAAIETERAALNESIEAKTREKASSGERIAEQQRLQAEAKAAVDSALDRRRELEKALEGLHGERQALHDRLSQAQAHLTELRERSEDLRTRLQEKKLRHSHSDAKRESAEAQMKEKYNVTPLEAQERQGLPGQPVPAPDLERLRRRVESMGPVNLAAPEEHAQLEERYNFLLSQQQDLLKAKEDLLTTIQKINATTRQNFRETFERVRENFKALYGQLFQGGEADLRFTDEADLLNTGVEIYAQPPGKKLQNIALLSGGEKALTAVSLLFAFFMVRPAPFAILDEVDAPLDEANVTRFITLIKAFTHQSQFLIITHNKRSMEMADTLYGVTMETLGVSRILSARLKKEGAATETAVTPETVLAGEETDKTTASG